MNYFAHAHVAAGLDGHAGFVLGAMLPDFAHMLGTRIARIEHAQLRAGEAHHHRVDRAFHGAPSFRELLLDGIRRLDHAGVSRGAARGAAHVGVELLLDGALVGDADRDAAYRAALASAPEHDGAIRWGRSDAGARWARLRGRLVRAGLPHDLRDPARVLRRVVRVLEPRPRLRLDACEQPAVEAWLADAQPRVASRASALVEETLSRL
ncbi:MAG: hypothetical protein ACQGVC_12110 [Myxococcota bacterium]